MPPPPSPETTYPPQQHDDTPPRVPRGMGHCKGVPRVGAGLQRARHWLALSVVVALAVRRPLLAPRARLELVRRARLRRPPLNGPVPVLVVLKVPWMAPRVGQRARVARLVRGPVRALLPLLLLGPPRVPAQPVVRLLPFRPLPPL